MSKLGLCQAVRANCAAVAARAGSVTIDMAALEHVAPEPPPPLDGLHHYLDGPPEAVAGYLLCLDTINFGSGWFPTLRKRPGCSGYITIAASLADHWRAEGGWSGAELRSMQTREVAAVLGQPADHELMALYGQALRQLGGFLGDRDVLTTVHEARSAEAFAQTLATEMSMFADRGFYKRAQIAAADLALAGIAPFTDLEHLTAFADNLVPHVLRCDGVLRYDERLAAHVDAGRPLRPGPQEREIRACAVHACELVAALRGVAPHALDSWLWNRGQAPEYKLRPRHRCRTINY